MPDDGVPPRPLPESLTRFLSDPAPRALPARAASRPRSSEAGPLRPNRALRIFLAWALAYNVLGFAIIVLLWKSLNG
ncbi:hypothetical protein [Methylorubrum salsuginis]|uniref:Uncharacterized protein n=1 Tax=Methylorubrum salsuginis TaxID=414703 RepID=A0A1I4HAT1_9HYPH|nr:hypothetical protein [Methylorubrum salsuginis]SFL38890.1 hypothetical protein SAMN04488125_11414 [Methylorubrum salsuginis]